MLSVSGKSRLVSVSAAGGGGGGGGAQAGLASNTTRAAQNAKTTDLNIDLLIRILIYLFNLKYKHIPAQRAGVSWGVSHAPGIIIAFV